MYRNMETLWRDTIKKNPSSWMALNNLADFLLTTKDAGSGNPTEALELAQRACELTSYQHPISMDTLAAAYHAAGNFPRAIETAEKAVRLARAANQHELAEAIENTLELYKAGKAYRER